MNSATFALSFQYQPDDTVASCGLVSDIAQAVCVVLLSEQGQVLVVSRRNKSDAWGLPGGKVDAGESSTHAAQRELREETGVSISEHLLLPLYSALVPKGPGPGGKEFWVTTYLYQLRVSPELQLTPEEGLLAKWVPPEFLQDAHGPFTAYNEQVAKALKAYLR